MNTAWAILPAPLRARWRIRFCVVGVLVLAVCGCAGPRLMPTPNVYRQTATDPFAAVPAVFRTNTVDLLYVTDRQLGRDSDGRYTYTYARSPALAFGSCVVGIGDDVSWTTLVTESRQAKRHTALPLRLRWVEEEGRFPNTPMILARTPAGIAWDGQAAMRFDLASENFERELERRLALTPRKEVFVFVHGFNNDFAWAAFVAAQVWHFLPRQGVPILYSWPAGRGGLRGYTYDRESSEFTVYHLRQLLRALIACPQVEKIHLIAHSRGTDVATAAVRELMLEDRRPGEVVGRVPKIANLILIAPDLDLQVASQRLAADFVPLAVGRLTLYVCEKDRAVNLANWLFEGIRRLGQVRVHDFTDEQKRYMRAASTVQFIDARVKVDFLGHGYFHDNPAVSSDLLQLLREDCDAGEDDCRPLQREQDLFWKITDDYLAPPH